MSFPRDQGPRARRCGTLAAALLLLALAGRAPAVTQLKRGADAPEIKLKDVLGTEVNTTKLREHVVLVVFGELYHDKTQEACKEIAAILRDPRLRDQDVRPLLVTAQEGKADEMKAEASKVMLTVLRDPQRDAYGAYQVAVMPSVVVIDKDGHVVVALAGMVPRFTDLVTDSLLFALGKLSAEQYERTLSPASQPATSPAEETALKADRLTALARQLARRGLDEMATEKLTEALQLDPHQTGAHLELGALLLKRKRLPDAEKQYRIVLAEQPQSLEATLGLAFVQAQRGGAELDPAERAVRDVLARNAAQPRAHYLLGLILQQRGKSEDAAASFRKAAELLLERGPEESAP